LWKHFCGNILWKHFVEIITEIIIEYMRNIKWRSNGNFCIKYTKRTINFYVIFFIKITCFYYYNML
jgi:hypothetical protein